MTKRASILLAACLLAPLFGTVSAYADSAEPVAVLPYSSHPKPSAYVEHAPLALFSLGSLVVGGVFYGINSSLDYPGSNQASGNGARVNMAIGAAGFTAVAAGACYVYYVMRGERKSPSWAGNLSG